MNRNKKWLYAGLLGIMSVLFTVLVRVADVAPIGPEGTEVGFSHINKAVFDLTGFNGTFYDLTTWLGYAVLLVAFGFAAAGLVQAVRRKSVLKVDREILVLGGLYVLLALVYVFFEKVVINYRTVIMPGCEHPEASYPSSHTMLVCVIMGSAMMLLKKYVRDEKTRGILRVVCAAVIAVMVIGRLLAGVHWLTDIIGGLLISAALLELYAALITDPARKDGKE